jgi:hypothetical protein
MRRPRADDWDDYWWPVSLGLGTVHDLADSSDEEPQKPQQVLWIPDPEARHSWREWYVSPEKPNSKPKGRIGFK